MALKFAMILEAIDRISGPAKRIRAANGRIGQSVRAMAQQIRRARGDVDSGARSLEHYRRRAERLRRVALGRTFQAAADGARRLGRTLRDIPRRLDLIGRSANLARSGLRGLGGGLANLARWGATAGVAAGGLAIFDLFRTAGQFEQYQVMLEGIEGSAQAAQRAAAWVQNFAQNTPYELGQVMEAFVALKSYGIDPMDGSLRALGDGASGMNKDLMQAVEAMADAMTGEFERLKEFGIRASQQGNRVVFSYRQNGRDMRREAANTGSAIEDALTGIFNDRFGGGMERQARTLFGIMSNVKDLWSRFLLMVADAGIFDRVKAKLDEWRQRLETMANDGRLQAWAQEISDRLENAFEWGVRFVEETNWSKVADDIRAVAEAAVYAARGIIAIVNAYNRLAKFDRRFTSAITDGGGWVNPATGLPVSGRQAFRRAQAGRPAGRAAGPGQAPADNGQGRRSWNGLMNRLRSHDAQRGVRAGAPAPQEIAVGGRVQVDISLAPELRAQQRGLRQTNPLVPFVLNTGHTMRGGS